MVFNSITFLVFFAVVLGVYHLPLPWKLKKLHLLLASYLFYAAWNPPFVLLIMLSTVVDWFVAKAIASSTAQRRRVVLLWVSVFTNLGLLAFFKYGDFVLQNFVGMLAVAGIDYQPPESSIILPVGISFYTFQTLSYTIDVYRGRLDPKYSFLDFALFVTFFPQLVAGPIVRASEFLPQMRKAFVFNRDRLGWGLGLLTVGLFEKEVMADGIFAAVVDQGFGNWQTLGTSEAWVSTLAFSGQIFFDFAGYSTCAIGAALCLGFVLPDNFRFPYAAIGFSDFWQRWHISLSSWLRDYLYISLGGNRVSKSRTYVNLMLTMLLGGLWHGASWQFVAWGFLHGMYLVIERLAKHLFGHIPFFGTLPGRLLLAAITFVAVIVAWVPFRATSFTSAFTMVNSMFGLSPFDVGDHIGTSQTAMGGRPDAVDLPHARLVPSRLARRQGVHQASLRAVEYAHACAVMWLDTGVIFKRCRPAAVVGEPRLRRGCARASSFANLVRGIEGRSKQSIVQAQCCPIPLV